MTPPEDNRPEDNLPEDNQGGDQNLPPGKGQLGPVDPTGGAKSPGTALAPVGVPEGPAPAVVSRPRILSTPPRVMDVLKAGKRRWLLATTLAVTFAVPVALIAWFFIPVTYSSQSWLQTGASSRIFQIKNLEASDWESHEELIRSYMVCTAALDSLATSTLPWIKEVEADGEDPVDWLSSQLTVDIPSSKREKEGYGNQLLRISMTGDDPGQLQKLVEAVTNAYLDRVVDEEKKGFLKQRDVLEKSYDRKAEELRTKREDLQQIARDIGTADAQTASAQQQLLLDHVLYLRRQVGELRQEYIQKERDLRVYEEQVGWLASTGNILPEDIEAELRDNPDLLQFAERLLELQKELESLQNVYRDKKAAPIVQKQKEIANLQAEQVAFEKRLRSAILTALRTGEKKSEVQQIHERLDMEARESKQHYDNTRSEFSKLSDDLQQLGEYSADLVRRQEELAQMSKVTGEVGYELEKIELELSAGGAERVRLYQQARVSKTGDTDQRDRMTIVGGAFGFVLGFLIVAVPEFYKRRITSGNDMSDGLGVRVLGSVPMLVQPKRRFAIRKHANDPIEQLQATMDESADGIRAMLLHIPAAESVRTLLVSSPLPNEGKTTVAVSLAASMGRSGRRTLLVDGDMRNPSAHRLLEMPLEDGLAEVLRGEVASENVIRPSQMAGLRFMSAGHCDHMSLQALTKENLGTIFHKLREEFDFIIVDSGPVLSVVDPLLLGQQCDAALLSVIRNVSRLMPAYETVERLQSINIPVVGCVINGLESSTFISGYYTYGYGYGHAPALTGSDPGESTS
ncbi:MAG: polysaccharide biosynthesis tyrosine autokinase [Pirellulales bacterium]|nr:polysaccharide biosynthesis tyrosine autokinase [Pirellulales bacterium]